MSDREIMRLYRSGATERAFEAIVSTYRERLYWHIRRFTCSHPSGHILEDLGCASFFQGGCAAFYLDIPHSHQ